MSAATNHAICDRCWVRRNPDRVPCRVLYVGPEKCCFCGEMTASGIYLRAPLDETICNGEHAE